MRKITYLYLLLCSAIAFAQNPVSWEFYSRPLGNNEFVLTARATIQDGWYLYSQHIPQSPPLPTTFSFDNAAKTYSLVGNVIENGKAIKEIDEENHQTIVKYTGRVAFEVRAKTVAPSLEITGFVNYMTCDKSRCLPPKKQSFSFKLINAANNTPAIVAGGNFKAPSAPKYSEEGYLNVMNGVELGEQEPVYAGDATRKKGVVTLPQNAADEVDIEKSGHLVAANIAKYLPKPKPIVKPKPIAAAKPEPVIVHVEDPVTWLYNLQKTNEKGVYDLHIVARIVDKWYLYSQNNEGDAPFATQFSFDNDPNIEWLDEGKVAEKGTLITTPDPVFGKNTQRYAQEVVFSRRVKFNENVALSGKVSFMAADDMHYNMPREQTFSVNNDLSVVPVTRPITATSWIIGLLVLAGIVATLFLKRKSKIA